MPITVLWLFVTTLQLANADWQDCKFNVEGKIWDLSSYNDKPFDGKDTKMANYEYHVSICNNLSETCNDIMTSEAETGAIYQMGTTDKDPICWDVLGKWDNSIVATQTNPGKNDTSLVLTFNNGDKCKSGKKQVTLTLECDQMSNTGSISGQQNPVGGCNWDIYYKGKAGCFSGTGPGPGPSPGGDGSTSVGTIMIISVASAALLYCIGGYIFCAFKNKEEENRWSPKTSCPHSDFWCGNLWKWTKAGALVTKDELCNLTGCCKCGCCKKGDTDGEEEDGDDGYEYE